MSPSHRLSIRASVNSCSFFLEFWFWCYLFSWWWLTIKNTAERLQKNDKIVIEEECDEPRRGMCLSLSGMCFEYLNSKNWIKENGAFSDVLFLLLLSWQCSAVVCTCGPVFCEYITYSTTERHEGHHRPEWRHTPTWKWSGPCWIKTWRSGQFLVSCGISWQIFT